MRTDTFVQTCDRGMGISLCAAVFVLPASIALLDSFAALAATFYLVKKIHALLQCWPSEGRRLEGGKKVFFVWRAFAPRPNALNRPLQFLTFAFFISVVFSQYPALSLLAFFGKFVKCLFLYFVVLETCANPKWMRVFVGCFLASAFMLCLSGTMQHYTGRDFIKGRTFGIENFVQTQRVSSAFYGANGFGAYLLPVVALVAHLFSKAAADRKWTMSVLAGLFLALLLANLCWTYSRSAWLGYLLILGLMAWLDPRKTPLSVVLFLVFIFVFLPSLNRVRDVHFANDNSGGPKNQNVSLLENMRPNLSDVGSGRKVYWAKAISIIRSSPLWGTGLNTYTRVIHKTSSSVDWRYAHNCYLQIAAETGLLGLVAFLWTVGVLFVCAFRHYGRITDPCRLPVLQGTICGLAGFLVQSFFDNTFYTVQLGMLMWLIFGMMMAVVLMDPYEKQPKDSNSRF